MRRSGASPTGPAPRALEQLRQLEQELTREHRRQNPWIDERALAQLIYGDERLTGLMNRLKRADPGLCVRVLAASVLREGVERPLAIARLSGLDREVLVVGADESDDLDDWRSLPEDAEVLDPISGQVGTTEQLLGAIDEESRGLAWQPLLRCLVAI